MQGLVEQYRQEHDVPAVEIAAALAKMSIGDKPMLLSPDKEVRKKRPERAETVGRKGKSASGAKRRGGAFSKPDDDKERYRIEVGYDHGVKPGNIVGAIANEAGLDGENIGAIEIENAYSLVDLPVGMPKDIFMDLKKVRVCGQALQISLYDAEKPPKKSKGKAKPTEKKKKKRSGKKRAQKEQVVASLAIGASTWRFRPVRGGPRAMNR